MNREQNCLALPHHRNIWPVAGVEVTCKLSKSKILICTYMSLTLMHFFFFTKKNLTTFPQTIICLLTCNIKNFWVIKWWNHNFCRKIFCWLTRRLEGYAIVHRTMTHLISQNFLFQLQNCVFAFLVLNRKLIRTFVIL